MSEMAVTGDDSCTCGLCGKETSLAMIVVHLANEHGVDPQEIANAPIIDLTAHADEERDSRTS